MWLAERSLSAARNASVLPSGDQDGELQEMVLLVRHCNVPALPLSMVSVYKSGHGRRQRSSARLEVKAMRVPLGDQAASLSSQSPSVSCCGSSPAISTRNRC